ncbi:dual specificity protein phosphatase 16 [Pseudorasbora parva]|uniref:dual specificity protein phosphatase 16 n=1 Tax=Pseudorasbora parva TaxID=51549 RepID=UPI00351E6157
MVECVRPLGPEALVALLETRLDNVLLIDCRPFGEFNACHILEAVNVNCSKLMKRRLQQDKIQITELLLHSAKRKLELQGQEVVVYDQSSSDPASLSPDAFLSVLLAKLEKSFPSVHLLSGGFSEFCRVFPALCEGKSAPLLCVSQPCVPVSSGPTRILPHLYLGCQRDVLSQELMQQNDIVFVLNVSHSCPKPDFILDSHFLRVPINDSFCEKILPWLDQSLEFIEKAKASNGRVLVHCLAGISRSATIAIAYIMKRNDMSLDEAYRFVKEKRPTISPNFNFLGQLLDFEKKLKSEAAVRTGLDGSGEPEEHLLARLRLEEDLKESSRPKRSFSLDIKPGAALRGFADSHQFSPVPEVSEQTSPDGERVGRSVCVQPRVGRSVCVQPLQRSGSVDESPSAGPHAALLKGWHSDILLGFLSSDSARFCSGSGLAQFCSGSDSARSGSDSTHFCSGLACFGSKSDSARFGSGLDSTHVDSGSDSAHFCSGSAVLAPGLQAVRRRGLQRSGGCGDSRRSWHEESSFEKQLKRSCQMSDSGENLGTTGSQSSFSGSLEIIEVS